jgi:hypothetical protein
MMISKSFTIKAFIALVTLAASLTPLVNAGTIDTSRLFLFFGPVVREERC